MAAYIFLLFFPPILNLFIGNNRKAFRNVMFIVLMLFLCLRATTVGGDQVSYKVLYNHIYQETDLLAYFLQHRSEPLFLIFNKACAFVSRGNYRFFLIASAAIFCYCFAKYIYEFSQRQWMSWFFLMAFGYLMYCLSGIRASLAMSIGLYSTKYILDFDEENEGKSLIKFLIGTIIAFLIHYSSFVLFLIPLYKILKKKKYYYFIYVALCALTFVFGSLIIPRLAAIFYSQKTYTFTSSGGYGLLGLILIIRVALEILVRDDFRDKGYENLTMLLELALILQILALSFNLWSRITEFVLMIPLILLPNYISETKLTRQSQLIVEFIIFGALLLFFYSQLRLDEANIVPYVLFWQE